MSAVPVWAWIALVNAAAVIAWVLIYVDELRPHAKDTIILTFTVIGCVVIALVVGGMVVAWLTMVEYAEQRLKAKRAAREASSQQRMRVMP